MHEGVALLPTAVRRQVAAGQDGRSAGAALPDLLGTQEFSDDKSLTEPGHRATGRHRATGPPCVGLTLNLAPRYGYAVPPVPWNPPTPFTCTHAAA